MGYGLVAIRRDRATRRNPACRPSTRCRVSRRPLRVEWLEERALLSIGGPGLQTELSSLTYLGVLGADRSALGGPGPDALSLLIEELAVTGCAMGGASP